VSLVSALVGVMACVTLPIVIALGEGEMLVPFMVTAGISFLVAAAGYFPRRGSAEAHFKHALVIAAVAWLVVAFLGAVPFFLGARSSGEPALGAFRSFSSALFESMSGFTTTGLSVIAQPEAIPRSLQWWRSFTQWVGGIGVIILVLGFTPVSLRPGRSLFYAERDEKIETSTSRTIRTMWWIYLSYTCVGAILLWRVGMPAWDAINHSMTALSTGGFSTVSDSIGHYGGWAVRLVILCLMFLGANSFAVNSELFSGKRPGTHANYHQSKWLAIVCGGAALLLVLANVIAPTQASTGSSVFQAVSAVTTTGFQTTSLRSWSEGAKLVLVLAMFVGGASGSTAGGIKVIRAVLLFRGTGWWLSRIISSPKRVLTLRFGRERLSFEEASLRVQGAAVMAFAWLVCSIVGALALMWVIPPEFTLGDSLLEVVSAQSTVGLSVGITNAGMSVGAKVILMFNMWIGRLEVIPVLFLFRAIFRGLR